MFLRIAIIMLFLAQPVMSLTGLFCIGDEQCVPVVQSCDCCCGDSHGVGDCPCIESNDTPAKPGGSIPATLPPLRLLLATPHDIGEVIIVPSLPLKIDRFTSDSGPSSTSRFLRTQICIWRT